MLQSPFKERIERGVQVLLDVPEGSEPWPDFAHRVDIQWVEGAKRGGIEMKLPRMAALLLLKPLVSHEDAARDDAGLELK